jgi:hypothetical protein
MCAAALAFSALSSHALSAAQFAPLQTQLNNDIATLVAIPEPSRAEKSLLRTLGRATNALAKSSATDGKTLKKINSLLHRNPDYTEALGIVASNLLVTFNNEYDFVGGTVIPAMPPSDEADVVAVQYGKLAAPAAKLNAATPVAKFAGLYDSIKKKLDNVFFRASQALTFPFPSDLATNSIVAKINDVNFRTSLNAGSENVFSAVATESNLTVTVSALATSGGSYSRGILFSVTNVQFGTFKYLIPDAVSFTNRTGVYSVTNETNVGATSGAMFIATTPTEVYGMFECSGPDFDIISGRFRITISSQP